jgi:Mg-chelatase subunit ChlD
MILGRNAQESMPFQFDGEDATLERTLEYLTGRDYQRRGHLGVRGGGTLDPSQLTALSWMSDAQKLFPKSTFEKLRADAIMRYGITDLLKAPGVAEQVTPSLDLAKAVLSIRGALSGELEDTLRTIIGRVVEQLLARLQTPLRNAVSGVRRRRSRSVVKRSVDFDAVATMRANLQHVDPETGRILIDRPLFLSRGRRSLDWEIIVLVDQSGSMAESVIYSAVVASVFAALPGLSVKLVLFDSSVVDVSNIVSDPVSVLMTAQLGGGTDIAKALNYAESLVDNGPRTVLVLISDFDEGGSVTQMTAAVRRMAESGVRLLGTAALDESAEAYYSADNARRLIAAGMEIAVLTPEHLADWVGEVTR